MMIDVTSRKLADAVLRESEERFRSIANDTPAYLWISSGDEESSFVNTALAGFLGTRETRLGKKWSDFLDPEDRLRVREKFLRRLAERRESTDEFRMRRFDGEYRWVFGQAIPRFSPTGVFLGYAGALVDITETSFGVTERRFL